MLTPLSPSVREAWSSQTPMNFLCGGSSSFSLLCFSSGFLVTERWVRRCREAWCITGSIPSKAIGPCIRVLDGSLQENHLTPAAQLPWPHRNVLLAAASKCLCHRTFTLKCVSMDHCELCSHRRKGCRSTLMLGTLACKLWYPFYWGLSQHLKFYPWSSVLELKLCVAEEPAQ